ncbi:MAG TPA: oligoribonuclease [Jiangellaceae bacterium]|nr:oligoribonuclease [Jiangellaceae bacterium]
MTSANPPQAPAKDLIVWIDCEMTGLDIVSAALIEIAVIITDSQLRPLDQGLDLVIKPPPESLTGMDPVVVQMHTESGLLDALEGGTTLADAQQQVLEYIKRFTPEARKAPLAGNSVGTDKMFLDRDMPELTEHLHYRIIDVSSIKELARRWYPRAYFNSPAKQGGHRALADIAESIDELRYYRAILFPADPGPDSASAKAVAAKIVESPTVPPAGH